MEVYYEATSYTQEIAVLPSKTNDTYECTSKKTV